MVDGALISSPIPPAIMTLRRSLLAFAFIPALFLAACATDEDAPVVEEPVAVEPVAQNDILAAAGDAGLTTLAQAVEAAGLVETLQGEGPFTVLAPTNEAFAALPEGTLESLMEEGNIDQLRSILTYHVVTGRIESEALAGSFSYSTVEGGDVTFNKTDDGVTITDANGNTVNVVTADVNVSNGVVHVIDGVLMPAVGDADSM